MSIDYDHDAYDCPLYMRPNRIASHKDEDGVNVGTCDDCGRYREVFASYDPESDSKQVCEDCLDKQIEYVNKFKEEENVPD